MKTHSHNEERIAYPSEVSYLLIEDYLAKEYSWNDFFDEYLEMGIIYYNF